MGLSFAGRRPKLVQRLILGNTFAWPADKGLASFSRVVGNSLARILICRYNMLAKWLIPAGINRKLTEPELAAYMGRFSTPISRAPTWIFAHQILASREYLAEVEAGLSKLREKPALLVWGEQDGAFREPERRRLMQYFIRHEVRLLPDATHFIQENAPDEICAAIIDAALPWMVQPSPRSTFCAHGNSMPTSTRSTRSHSKQRIPRKPFCAVAYLADTNGLLARSRALRDRGWQSELHWCARSGATWSSSLSFRSILLSGRNHSKRTKA